MTIVVPDQYSLIMNAGRHHGSLWQSGYLTEEAYALPGPLFVVQMCRERADYEAVHNPHFRTIIGVLAICIDDTPESALPDSEYLAAIDTVIAYLDRKINVLIHCAAGVSRSCYLTLGVLVARFGLSLSEAEGFLTSSRIIAQPNAGFLRHLRTLEPQLRHRDHTQTVDNRI